MKKLTAIVAGLAMVLAIGIAATTATGKASKSKVTIAYTGGGAPYHENPGFRGAVKPQGNKKVKKACSKNRKVSVYSDANGDRVANGKTNKKGKYALKANGKFVGGDSYFAEVDEKTVKITKKKKGKKKKVRVTCKYGFSKSIVAG